MSVLREHLGDDMEVFKQVVGIVKAIVWVTGALIALYLILMFVLMLKLA